MNADVFLHIKYFSILYHMCSNNAARSTIWKKAIESGVIASCRNAHDEWLKAAKA